MPDTTNPQPDLPDRLEAALTERFTELGNPFSAMRRQEKGPDGWPASHPVGPHQVAEVLRELLAAAPVPPPAPTDRAGVLCDAADSAYRIARRLDDQHHDQRAQGAWDVENALRAEARLAVEAPAASRAGGETQTSWVPGPVAVARAAAALQQPDDGPPAPLRRAWDDCPGFPEKCPNIRPVDPDPPTHLGGIRCGCADEESTS